MSCSVTRFRQTTTRSASYFDVDLEIDRMACCEQKLTKRELMLYLAIFQQHAPAYRVYNLSVDKIFQSFSILSCFPYEKAFVNNSTTEPWVP